MKLYVTPVEKACNASCDFCITNFRETSDKEFLRVNDLEAVLSKYNFDSIEITGGGEPLMHSKIADIANLCVAKSRTQIYTNGVFYKRLRNVEGLEFLSVSRAHYGDSINERIMGIKYDIYKIFEAGFPLKLSLLLLKSGVHSKDEVSHYLDWAHRHNVKKVIVRQLFDESYNGVLDGEYVSTLAMASNFVRDVSGENVFFDWDGMNVEFETRSCACEFHNPVLHADGKLYKGWSREVLDDSYRT
jgi:MoaA/NifB/PqqE/SkfB family radical SAM enzyme